jgi:hypothetical protein
MANKKTEDETIVENAGLAEPAVKSERKVPIEKLRRSCVKLFGVTPSTFDGATVGLTGKYTIEEMQTTIDSWLKKEVK